MADITEKLERLFSLLEAGALTREQIEEQRDILLTEARRDSGPPSSGSASGEPGSATALLQMLGVAQAPTLHYDGAGEPSPATTPPLPLGRWTSLGWSGKYFPGEVSTLH